MCIDTFLYFKKLILLHWKYLRRVFALIFLYRVLAYSSPILPVPNWFEYYYYYTMTIQLTVSIHSSIYFLSDLDPFVQRIFCYLFNENKSSTPTVWKVVLEFLIPWLFSSLSPFFIRFCPIYTQHFFAYLNKTISLFAYISVFK